MKLENVLCLHIDTNCNSPKVFIVFCENFYFYTMKIPNNLFAKRVQTTYKLTGKVVKCTTNHLK